MTSVDTGTRGSTGAEPMNLFTAYLSTTAGLFAQTVSR
jgi:hypothetical protein